MERMTERSKTGTAFFDDDGALIRGAGGVFHQKKDMTASFIHQRFVALDKAIDCLAAYEDAMPLERAQELAQAEKDGRLVVLPFKMGDMVWADTAIVGDRYKSADRPYSVEVVFIGMGKENGFFHVQYSNGRIFPFDFDKVGKVVFLTREEAEAALKKREAENEAD